MAISAVRKRASSGLKHVEVIITRRRRRDGNPPHDTSAMATPWSTEYQPYDAKTVVSRCERLPPLATACKFVAPI
jgi:hypothetical protein